MANPRRRSVRDWEGQAASDGTVWHPRRERAVRWMERDARWRERGGGWLERSVRWMEWGVRWREGGSRWLERVVRWREGGSRRLERAVRWMERDARWVERDSGGVRFASLGPGHEGWATLRGGEDAGGEGHERKGCESELHFELGQVNL